MSRAVVLLAFVMSAVVVLLGPVAEVLDLPSSVAEAKKKKKKKRVFVAPPPVTVH